jgi:serine/threonine-protein kinase
MSSPDGNMAGPDPLVGQVFFDRYRVLRRLEARRGARLYAGRHVLLDRPVAVEVLEAPDARPEAIDRFLEASRTIARVGHENVVEIFNGGRSPGGAVFLAMEALDGGTLAHLVAREGPILWDRAQGIVLQIAAALAAVHRHGVVHGDLRPENVVLLPRASRRDFVKVLDFGVARARAAAADPAYAAPETRAGGPDAGVDVRSEVYALGAVAYHMVTGRPPLAPEAPSEAAAATLAAKRATAVPAAPSSLRPEGTLPADLDGVILRALDEDPDKRYPDMTAFADALGRSRLSRRQSVRVEALAIAELSGKTDAFERYARKRRRLWSLASVATAVAIAIGVLHVLKTAPGHVQISTVPADADLSFDGLPVQARSPVVLDAAPGRYTLFVSRDGFSSALRFVEVAARQTVSISVKLAPLPPSRDAPAPTAAPSTPSAEAAAPTPGARP